MDEPNDPNDLDTQFEQMREKANDLMTRCHFRSAARLNAETARLARSSGQAMHYLYSRFHQMDQSQNILDFATMKECAVELIAVVEDEDRARAIQPDLPQGYYEYTQQWMTACLYENLAEATGMTDGYNSTGMHQCIGDGIQVCRRTGKMQCISCFREYASDVYIAADDLLMARHQCETNISRESGWSDRGDRRWFASIKVSGIHLLEGRLDLALESAVKAMELVDVEGVTLKMECRMRVLVDTDAVLILSGADRINWSTAHPEGLPDYPLPEGEWPVMEFKVALNDALDACCRNQPEEAIQILAAWDRRLTEFDCGNFWFELRLRLVAAMLLAGQNDRADRLAAQLREKATAANDFLTLRRLDGLLDKSTRVNPLASLEPLNAGPFSDTGDSPTAHTTASQRQDSENESAVERDDAAANSDEEKPPTELQIQLMEILRGFFTEEDESKKAAIIDQFLALGQEHINSAEDICSSLHIASILGPHSSRHADFWSWGQAFERHHSDEPSVISMVAVLGEAFLSDPNSPVAEMINEEDLLKRHQLALSMDANRIGNHLRAGSFHLARGDEGEAERCLARAFRLDRTCVPAAMQLAEVYQRTDRLRDSMEVLDICLREGGRDPNLALEATTLSLLAGQFEATLSYADKVLEFAEEDVPWLDYYRAIALIELGRFEAALQAVEAEKRHEQSNLLHLDLLSECALLGLGRTEEAVARLTHINRQTLSDVKDLTFNALCRLYAMTWQRLQESDVPEDEPARVTFDQILLVSGLAPDTFFEMYRELDSQRQSYDPENAPDVNFYRCLVKQTLNDSWKDSLGCLAGQQEWPYYLTIWSVLATDENDAERRVREWQSKCFRASCEVVDMELDSGPYKDHPGIVAQGMRWYAPEEND